MHACRPSTERWHARCWTGCTPGVLLLQRVDFNSKEQYYSEQNWRMLQQAFKKLGIDYVRLLRLSSPSPTTADFANQTVLSRVREIMY